MSPTRRVSHGSSFGSSRIAGLLAALLLAGWTGSLGSPLAASAGQNPSARVVDNSSPAAQNPQAQVVDDISPAARAQIDALIREKESRTPAQRKIDSQLIYEMKMARGEALAVGVQTLETDVPRETDARIIVDVTAAVSDALLEQVRALGAEVVAAQAAYTSMRLLVSLDELEPIAALPQVIFIQPKQEAMTHRWSGPPDRRSSAVDRWNVERRVRPRVDKAALASFFHSAFEEQEQQTSFTAGQGSKASEGEFTHRAFAARGTFNTTGAGVKIGVLSDGVRNLAASQALGDLGTVTVLGTPDPCAASPTTCDEGTAMLEIVHDIAPGAQLYFASAFVSITDFAQKIRDLQAAGCTIIVDDVGYFVETPFQDGQAAGVVSNTNAGVVIQAVKDVAALGVLYFSSAANSGNLNDGTSGTWEGDFLDGGATAAPLPSPGAGRLHNFNTIATPQTFDVLNIASTTAPVTLHWSDPLGGSGNDYDLFRLNSTGASVLASSTNVQNGTQDPFESVTGTGAAVGQRVVVVKSNAAAGRFLHVSTNRGRLSIPTSGETHGHAATSAANSFGVAAVSAGSVTLGNPFVAGNVVETFSSDGLRRIFFTESGTAITPGNFASTGGQVLNKPDITAADGVSVTGVGNFPSPFFGTSAAAPHAAAIAGLIKAANPSLTPVQIRTALVSSAIDIEAAGFDRDSGSGIIMAYQALQAAGITGTAFLADTVATAVESPGNGNGVINVGEGAQLNVTLTNLGLVNATNISATLTTSTTGVTVTLPGTSAYPDIAIGATGTNTTPFRFTMASNAACPLTVNFTLTVSYTGGSGTPTVLTIPVATGPQLTITTTLDGTAPAAQTGVTIATGIQTGRVTRNGVTSTCAAPKAFPGLQIATGDRQFDSYAFSTCAENTGGCATVSIVGTNVINLFTVAYRPSHTAASPGTNYLADPGFSSNAASPYSFTVPTGVAQPATVVVHEVNTAGGVGTAYTLTVSGLCGGKCATPNQVPIARARNVTVPAGPGGAAVPANIDNGSSDPDGDTLTITQSPPGPYSPGVTSVRLTVTDPKGATSQATGNVTVDLPPTVTITSPTSAATFASNATSIDVGGTASDDFGLSTVTWVNDRGGSGTASGTSTWAIAGIALQPGANVITVTATDTLSQTATDTITVTRNLPPTIAITSPATATVTTTATAIEVAGTASDDVGVSQVTWANNRGGSGTATGTTSWSISAIPLLSGINVITVTASDAGGLTATAQITVTVPPTMTLMPSTINFGVVNNVTSLVPITPTQTLTLTQSGPATVTWTVSANQPWISVTPASGSGGGTLTVTIINPPEPNQLPPIGSLSGTVTVNTVGAANSPSSTVNLKLVVTPQLTTPVGSFDTPSDGQNNITGSIAVTGWAIDDIGAIQIDITRDPVVGEGASQVFIGNAVFVSGARPDIAALYPLNPLKDQAGWGYLLLTNFLPNQGNGTFKLSAYAVDVEGNRVLLGSKTITCTNATATAPFGAIDTPGQGGTVSGSFVNFGWALAGQPTGRSILINGSTIQVLIDSVSTGTVDSYNNRRSDIETLFPGYFNSTPPNGAIGVRTINSATFANGVHTIAWIVTDNLGAAAGIGSRFFTVSNSSLIAGLRAADAVSPDAETPSVIDAMPSAAGDAASLAAIDRSDGAVMLRRGFEADAPAESLVADADGVRQVRTAQLERAVVDLGSDDRDAVYRGYSLDGDLLRALPIGSHLDEHTGEFAWAPPLAFGGTHKLLFVREALGRAEQIRVDVTVDAQPATRGEPRLVIDVPAAGAAVGNRFTIAGWAFDPAGPVNGTGIDTFHVWAYPARGGNPMWVGVAAIGGTRPDVAAMFGPRFARSGFSIDSAGLPAGTYDIVVYAHSIATDSFAIARSVRVTIR